MLAEFNKTFDNSIRWNTSMPKEKNKYPVSPKDMRFGSAFIIYWKIKSHLQRHEYAIHLNNNNLHLGHIAFKELMVIHFFN